MQACERGRSSPIYGLITEYFIMHSGSDFHLKFCKGNYCYFNIEAVAFRCVRLISFHYYINGASLSGYIEYIQVKGKFCLTLCLDLPHFEVYIRDVSFYNSGNCVDVVSVWCGPHLRYPCVVILHFGKMVLTLCLCVCVWVVLI